MPTKAEEKVISDVSSEYRRRFEEIVVLWTTAPSLIYRLEGALGYYAREKESSHGSGFGERFFLGRLAQDFFGREG